MPTQDITAVSRTIWGRANSVNVQKVLWCFEELGLEFERIDAGMHFGRNKDAAYLAMNPNGRVPTLVEGDFILWESNTILRYLAAQYDKSDRLYPTNLRQRARVDRWLDWTISSYAPAERDLYWGLVRTAPDKRDIPALQKIAEQLALLWQICDEDFAHGPYIGGEAFTIADICLGAFARRWFGMEGVAKPPLPRLAAWFDRIKVRPGYQHYLTDPLT